MMTRVPSRRIEGGSAMTPRPLGVGLVPMETRRDVVLRLATRAEELGYTSFSVAEGWGHDAAVLLTEIACRTERIRLAAGVLNIWGRSPATIAMLASSLAQVSGGRFDLGLGAGSPQLAEGLHDVEFRAPVARLADVTRQVRRLLDGERLLPTVPGRSRPLRLAVPPTSEIPIQLAALGPRAVRVSGELADAWIPFLLPRSGLADSVRLLEEGAAGNGRNRPRVRPALPVAVAPDRDSARQLAAWWVTFYLSSMGPLYAQTLREHGLGGQVDAVLAAAAGAGGAGPDDSLLDELVLWGEPAAAREGLARWYTAGAESPAIVLPPGRPVDELEFALEAFSPQRGDGGPE
jgi:alkanesulfonate monooxygenase SsuD/methylene tetrahydromethanopterin reductase-like flavin-dependent oxidoreductase (luciferase family)